MIYEFKVKRPMPHLKLKPILNLKKCFRKQNVLSM